MKQIDYTTKWAKYAKRAAAIKWGKQRKKNEE
jgi:hypothetical protein